MIGNNNSGEGRATMWPPPAGGQYQGFAAPMHPGWPSPFAPPPPHLPPMTAHPQPLPHRTPVSQLASEVIHGRGSKDDRLAVCQQLEKALFRCGTDMVGLFSPTAHSSYTLISFTFRIWILDPFDLLCKLNDLFGNSRIPFEVKRSIAQCIGCLGYLMGYNRSNECVFGLTIAFSY